MIFAKGCFNARFNFMTLTRGSAEGPSVDKIFMAKGSNLTHP